MKLTRLAFAAIAFHWQRQPCSWLRIGPHPTMIVAGGMRPHRNSRMFSARDSTTALKLPTMTSTDTTRRTWSGEENSAIHGFHHRPRRIPRRLPTRLRRGLLSLPRRHGRTADAHSPERPAPEHERGGWDAPPQEFRDVQRQGFHDGLEAGHDDFNRRNPQTWGEEENSAILGFHHPTATHIAKASAAATTRPSHTSAKAPAANDSPRSFHGFPDHAFQSWEAVFTGTESDHHIRYTLQIKIHL